MRGAGCSPEPSPEPAAAEEAARRSAASISAEAPVARSGESPHPRFLQRPGGDDSNEGWALGSDSGGGPEHPAWVRVLEKRSQSAFSCILSLTAVTRAPRFSSERRRRRHLAVSHGLPAAAPRGSFARARRWQRPCCGGRCGAVAVTARGGISQRTEPPYGIRWRPHKGLARVDRVVQSRRTRALRRRTPLPNDPATDVSASFPLRVPLKRLRQEEGTVMGLLKRAALRTAQQGATNGGA